MSGIQRSPFYKEDGDFVFQLRSTLYKVEADTFLTQSRPLKAAIDRSVPNVGSSDSNPFQLNGEIIEQDDFDALIEFYYDPATADTREKCLSILSACLTLDLPETEATVQAILETIDSSGSGTRLSSTIPPVVVLNLPLAPVNAVNVKADKLLAKYQKRLRDLNNAQAAWKERLDRIREVRKRAINRRDGFRDFFQDVFRRHSESSDNAENFGT
ncbi:hypothetical protein ARMGADRAFT_1013186 [Armillaria gallica]|uniref:BTB domain-containing protein n=1 Tax=Armillaria gallica TaxID=47427 RepID=A0A2H3DBL5_ARMGA|nr:hypothetical protein ARMGADRAFT_1013186 [Armillaria gallica]